MRRTLLASAPVLALLLSSAAHAQSVTVGSLPPTPNFVVETSLTTIVDLAFPANAAGELDTATFVWSSFPCPTAVKIKFFRPSGDTLLFLGERGPFDVNASTQSVTLSPTVPVLAGDLLGVASLTNCGGLAGRTPGAPAGYTVFGADVVSNVALADGTTTTNATVAVQATGLIADRVSGIIPAVGSTAGVPPSFFRTSVQLFNPGPTPISGRFVFHPQGVPGSSSDPSLSYSLQSGETQSIPDLLPAMGQVGLGSLDLEAAAGTEPPVLAVRVFNDGGEAGTTGFTEETVLPTDALETGDRGFLLGPPDTTLFRFNIGVRTLSTGAQMTITARDAAGAVLRTVTKSYPANYFQQQNVAPFLGLGAGETFAPNTSLTIDVTSGSAIVYGATADNRTQDPSMQIARKIS